MSEKPRRPGSMSDEARALAAIERRRRSAPMQAVPEPAVDEPSDGTPNEELEEITSPVDLLARELTNDEVELCNELVARTPYTSAQSPATLSDFVKVIKRLNAVKVANKRNRTDSANQALAVLGEKGPALDRLAALERKMRVVWGLLAAAGTAATGSIVSVAKGLYERGADEGAQKVRLDHFERDNERLRVELKELRDSMRRRSLDYPMPSITPKGSP